jgi:type I restriction enzyme M protein
VGRLLVGRDLLPLEVIEQITYLMFIRRLDDIQRTKENLARRTGAPVENPIFAAKDQLLRWSWFATRAPTRC